MVPDGIIRFLIGFQVSEKIFRRRFCFIKSVLQKKAQSFIQAFGEIFEQILVFKNSIAPGRQKSFNRISDNCKFKIIIKIFEITGFDRVSFKVWMHVVRLALKGCPMFQLI